MHELIRTKTSIALAMLVFVFFLPQKLFSLPLTETIYTIPEGEIEFTLQEQLFRLNNNFRIDQAGLGFGILPNLSLWFYTQILHEGVTETKQSAIGDTFIKLLYYMNSLHDETVHIGFLMKFRVPTGEDTYAFNRWRQISFGNNEIKTGPVVLFALNKMLNLHLNLLYLFREGENEDFYGSFRLKLMKGETYKKIFGLNPYYEDSFLEKKRLRNDFIIISTSLNTGIIYPLIPYIELQWSRRISPWGKPDNEPPIAPLKTSPVLESTGLRYFFSRVSYAGLYAIINPLHIRDSGDFVAGFEVGLQF